MIKVTSFESPVFLLPCPPVGETRAQICSKNDFERIIGCILHPCKGEAMEAVKRIAPDTDPFVLGLTGCLALLRAYSAAVKKYIGDNPDYFGLPDKPDFDGEEDSTELLFPIMTSGERIVYEHTGLSFIEIGELDYIDYRLLLADAVKVQILRNKTDGKKYLNECYNAMHHISDIFG